MSHRFYDASETAALLPYGALRDELAMVLSEHETGRLFLKERVILPLPQGTLLAMPASDSRLSITKVVTVHPGNTARGLPTIAGEVIVARADDGTRLGLLHGGTVTMRRTAALSLLAARLMGVEERASSAASAAARHLLMLGAGDQARGHAEAFTEELAVDAVTVASRTPHKAESLAAVLRSRGVATEVVAPGTPAFQRALRCAGIIVTATTSTTPVITGAVRPDATIFAVGAYRADMAELSRGVVATARRVVVDTLAGAQHEAGELIQASAAGVWEWSSAETLLELLTGAGTGAMADSATQRAGTARNPRTSGGAHQIFKSVGHAMYDLAAARIAFPET